MSHAHVVRVAVIGARGGDGHALFYRLAPGACVKSYVPICNFYRAKALFKMSFSDRLMFKNRSRIVLKVIYSVVLVVEKKNIFTNILFTQLTLFEKKQLS